VRGDEWERRLRVAMERDLGRHAKVLFADCSRQVRNFLYCQLRRLKPKEEGRGEGEQPVSPPTLIAGCVTYEAIVALVLRHSFAS
jgi:hypothetical protein